VNASAGLPIPRARRFIVIRFLALIAAASAALILLLPARATVPKDWHPPGYEGSYQFLESTWTSVGGATSGGHWASVAPLKEQTYRAWLLWRRSGGSWSQWGTAGMCGLR
jgi:hypothetical protein